MKGAVAMTGTAAYAEEDSDYDVCSRSSGRSTVVSVSLYFKDCGRA